MLCGVPLPRACDFQQRGLLVCGPVPDCMRSGAHLHASSTAFVGRSEVYFRFVAAHAHDLLILCLHDLFHALLNPFSFPPAATRHRSVPPYW